MLDLPLVSSPLPRAFMSNSSDYSGREATSLKMGSVCFSYNYNYYNYYYFFYYYFFFGGGKGSTSSLMLIGWRAAICHQRHLAKKSHENQRL